MFSIFFNKIFDYVKCVVNPANGGAEAKLFISITVFLVYILPVSLLDFFTAYEPSEFIFYSNIALCLSCLGIEAIAKSSIEKQSKKAQPE
jgi:hypothetical protein